MERRFRLPHGSGVLLVPAAAFGVHQLRYWLAYGRSADAQLIAQGHSYLHSLVPWVVLTLGIGATLFLRRLALAFATGDPGRRDRLSDAALWSLTTAALLGIYTIQETLESFLTSGHPGGVAGVFGHGGLWALPAAAAIALVVVAALRAGRSVVAVAAALRPAPLRLQPLALGLPASVPAAVVRPLARAGAGRAPPRWLRP